MTTYPTTPSRARPATVAPMEMPTTVPDDIGVPDRVSLAAAPCWPLGVEVVARPGDPETGVVVVGDVPTGEDTLALLTDVVVGCAVGDVIEVLLPREVEVGGGAAVLDGARDVDVVGLNVVVGVAEEPPEDVVATKAVVVLELEVELIDVVVVVGSAVVEDDIVAGTEVVVVVPVLVVDDVDASAVVDAIVLVPWAVVVVVNASDVVVLSVVGVVDDVEDVVTAVVDVDVTVVVVVVVVGDGVDVEVTVVAGAVVVVTTAHDPLFHGGIEM